MVVYMWYPALMFIVIPFIIAYKLGNKNAMRYLLGFVVINAVMLLAFATGLLLTAGYKPSSYWQNYVMPTLWTSVYTNWLDTSDAFFMYMLIPYVFYADVVKVFIHFTLTNGTMPLLFCEFVGVRIIMNLYGIPIGSFSNFGKKAEPIKPKKVKQPKYIDLPRPPPGDPVYRSTEEQIADSDRRAAEKAALVK